MAWRNGSKHYRHAVFYRHIEQITNQNIYKINLTVFIDIAANTVYTVYIQYLGLFLMKKQNIILTIIVSIILLIIITPPIYDHIVDFKEDLRIEKEKTEYLEKLPAVYDENKEDFEIIIKAFEGKYSVLKENSENESKTFFGKYFYESYAMNGDTVLYDLTTESGEILSKNPDCLQFRIFTDEELNALRHLLGEQKFYSVQYYIRSENDYCIDFIRYQPSKVTQKTQYQYITFSSYGISYSTNSYIEYLKEFNRKYNGREYSMEYMFQENKDGVWEYYIDYYSFS